MENIIKVLMSDKKQLSDLDWILFRIDIGFILMIVGFTLSAFINLYFFFMLVIGLITLFFTD